jgi:hypothetical protein
LFGQFFPGHLPYFEKSSREIEASPTPNEHLLAPTLYPQSVTTIGVEPSGSHGGHSEVMGAIRLIGIGVAADAF